MTPQFFGASKLIRSNNSKFAQKKKPALFAPKNALISRASGQTSSMSQPKLMPQKKGRPNRSVIECVRTELWYVAVRQKLRGRTEAYLERIQDPNAMRPRHSVRGTKWSRYRSGLSSPPDSLVQAVDKLAHEPTLVYRHPVWASISESHMDIYAIGALVSSLSGPVADLFLEDKNQPLTLPIWLRPGFATQNALQQLTSGTSEAGVKTPYIFAFLDRTAAIVALIHLAVHFQNEGDHVESHLALLRHTQACSNRFAGLNQYWRLATYLTGRWLTTQYQSKDLREFMAGLNAILPAEEAPWNRLSEDRQLSLPLRKVPVSEDKQREVRRELQAYAVVKHLIDQDAAKPA